LTILAFERSFEAQIAHGYLLDGLSARHRPVQVFLQPDGLRYQADDGICNLWTFADTDWDASEITNATTRLRSRSNEDIALVIEDANLIRDIRVAYKEWMRSHFWHSHHEARTIIVSTSCVAAGFLFLWFLWPSMADAVAPMVPESWRDHIGSVAYEEMVGSKTCASVGADEALYIIQSRLSGHRPKLQSIHISIFDSSLVNAWALPDGQVVITRGLLKKAKSADEVAGIIAHEFGHVLHDHVMRGMLRGGLPVLIARSLGADFGQMSGLMGLMVENAHSRKFESEADSTALDLLYDAHISTKGFAAFFDRERVEKNSIGAMLKYFSDHPPSDERASMIAHAREPVAKPLLTEVQWHDLRTVCGQPTK
jgi:beta-barrel assembly-enhancing protease